MRLESSDSDLWAEFVSRHYRSQVAEVDLSSCLDDDDSHRDNELRLGETRKVVWPSFVIIKCIKG